MERYGVGNMCRALRTQVLEADPDIARQRCPAKHKHTDAQMVEMQRVAR